MDLSMDDLNMDTLKAFIDEQTLKLELDKLSLKKFEEFKSKHYETNNCDNIAGAHKNVSVCMQENNIQENEISMPIRKSSDQVFNSRELEKDKLIKSISSPRDPIVHQPKVNRFSVNQTSPRASVPDSREQEKDRLAAIFAASRPSHFSNPSLSCGRSVVDSAFLAEAQSSTTAEVVETVDDSDLPNTSIPEIRVSEYHGESDSNNTLTSAMVRIGEFSPLNYNIESRHLLGIGEHSEERRRIMLDRRKQDYNQYLQQQVGQSSPGRSIRPRLRTVATQTEQLRDSSFSNEVTAPSPQSSPIMSRKPERESSHRRHSFVVSPVNNSLNDLHEKEVKEQLYRQELQRQIEEKNMLKELSRQREKEEEAKIDEKIQRDLEKMRRQYEEDKRHRLELVIRRKEQEDLLRQRLAAEQQRAFEESRSRREQQRQSKSNNKACHKSTSCNQPPRVSTRRPTEVPSSLNILSEVHEMFRQPLVEVPGNRRQNQATNRSPPVKDFTSNKPSAHCKDMNTAEMRTASSPLKEDDIRVQTSGADYTRACEHGSNKPYRLVEEEHDAVWLPVSRPSLDTSSPHCQSSPSPPLPTSRRSNCEILDDKWMIPDSEAKSSKPTDNGPINRSVLTELGEFRRHLQQERLRMQQRVRDDSP